MRQKQKQSIKPTQYILHNRPNLIVFLSNFSLMTIELVAARIIAPFVGVSLYTWTSVIGIVLLGITIGNFYGGKIADKKPSYNILSYALIMASFTTLLSILLLYISPETIFEAKTPYILQVLWTTSLFLPPSIMLGTISPMVIKLTVKNLKKTGNTVGNIYASSALGSILGTFATGFFLISMFGTKTIILFVATLLFFMALGITKLKTTQIIIFLSTLILLMILLLNFSNLCDYESNYYCIRVTFNKDRKVKILTLDKYVNSRSDLANPLNLELNYTKIFALFYEYAQPTNSPILFIGGGGYTLPRYLTHKYQQPDIEVVEIDPKVSTVAYELFDMPKKSFVKTINIDARIYLKNLEDDKKYASIYGDAFSDLSIPYHLTTKEFSNLVNKHLQEDGYYVVNVIDQPPRNLFLKSYISTLTLVFKHIYLLEPQHLADTRKYYNFVVVSGNHPLNLTEVYESTKALGYEENLYKLYSQEELTKLLEKDKKQIILTDNHAPVDNLLFPLF